MGQLPESGGEGRAAAQLTCQRLASPRRRASFFLR